ncbi:MAG: MBL fold metallo-hydrolase [Lentisphaeria bacterium]|nr:MBL fold metallo-hydrolase [Lentisphaeria bacterium]
MKLRFLGSAASESIPALWCECPNCRRAMELGGRNIRRRTSYLIGDHTLVDFGPDANWQMKEFRIDPAKIGRILMTHSHVDHFNPVDLLWRNGEFSLPGRRIGFYANAAVLAELDRRVRECSMGKSLDALHLKVVEAVPGVSVRDGALTVLPVRAAHAPGECALNYVVEEGGGRILIANDTGWWPPESWELLRDRPLDVAVIEISMGIRMPYAGERGTHLGAKAAIAFRDRLAELGAVTASTQVAVTHISHHVGATHEELEAYFRPHGMLVGFDGLKLGGEA